MGHFEPMRIYPFSAMAHCMSSYDSAATTEIFLDGCMRLIVL